MRMKPPPRSVGASPRNVSATSKYPDISSAMRVERLKRSRLSTSTVTSPVIRTSAAPLATPATAATRSAAAVIVRARPRDTCLPSERLPDLGHRLGRLGAALLRPLVPVRLHQRAHLGDVGRVGLDELDLVLRLQRLEVGLLARRDLAQHLGLER